MTKTTKLVVFLLFISVIKCSHICSEDGLYENVEDRTSFYECVGGKRSFRRCPTADDGLSYLVFNGEKCVHSHTEFVCPQKSGKYRYVNDERQYYECEDEKPVLKNCPQNTKFDGLECAELHEVETVPSPIDLEDDEEKEFTCPSPTGVYTNPDDRHSFYECNNSEPKLKLCPREKSVHLHGANHGKHRRRMIWDGHQCVQVHRISDNRSARQAAQTQDYMFNCPQPDGFYPDPRNSRYYFRCVNNKAYEESCAADLIFSAEQGTCVPPIVAEEVPIVPNEVNNRVQPRQILGSADCPSGTTYDAATGKCQREEVVSPLQVEQRGPAQCPSGSTYDPSTGRCREQVYAEPIRTRVDVSQQCPSGSVYDSASGQCRQEIIAEPIRTAVVQPVETTRCPSGYVYDAVRGQCRGESVVEPIRTVVQPQVSTTCPPGYTYDTARGQCVTERYIDPIATQRYERRCPSGYTYDTARGLCVRVVIVDPRPRPIVCEGGSRWDPSLRRCVVIETGRYRRNGRVETEDKFNGAVIVDTWNERQWRWDRNPNGNRILPDVNGWLDRSLAYRRDRGNYPYVGTDYVEPAQPVVVRPSYY